MRPAFLRRGRDAEGRDRAAGMALRITGLLSLPLAALGVLMLGTGAWTLWQIQTRGDQGWDGLIAGIALGLGLLSALSAVGLAAASHVGLRAWNEHRPRPVLWVGVALTAIGATFWMPRAWQAYATPLDDYLAMARFVLLALGIAVLVGRQ